MPKAKADCMTTRGDDHTEARLRPLTEVPRREPVTVRSLAAGEPAAVRRLAELGLTPGAAITVLQRSSVSLIVSTRSSRVAVGRHLAEGVLVGDRKSVV